jgi:hypothetical protein
MMRLVCLLALAAGCYHPKIADGTIFCSDDMPPKCPSGFQCGWDGICYKMPPVMSPYGQGDFGTLDLSNDTGVMILHTQDGRITLLDPMTGTSRELITPSPVPVPAFAQTNGGPDVTIWSFKELRIPPTIIVQLSPDSQNAPVLASTGLLKMLGNVDFSGSGGANGPANSDGSEAPGSDKPGGGGAPSGSGGGGGGGNLAAGTPGMGSVAGGGGAINPNASDSLTFGSGGGGGSGVAPDGTPGFGGTGGGALALLGQTVEVNAQIDLSGLPGQPAGGGMAGGGGGGAGGTLLISANLVVLGPNLTIKTLGGLGGHASNGGGDGGAGSAGRIRILGDKFDDSTTARPDAFQPTEAKSQVNGALSTFP